MKFFLTLLCISAVFNCACFAQENEMYKAAEHFLSLLDNQQKEKILYPFDTTERYAWYYVPKDDRKGLTINEMNEQQRNAAVTLMKTALSKQGYDKATAIMSLEKVLKAIENRDENDHYRDTGKYFFTLFNKPSKEGIWGWRIDGHHLSLSFCSAFGKLVSVTPGFFGSNPAIVLSGPEKGVEILKDETQLGLELVHALTKQQLEKTVIDSVAPGDIITLNKRTAMIENPVGLNYKDMTKDQQKIFMQLLSIYIQRYTHLFAAGMMKEIESAGIDKLLFAWAGSMEGGPGHPKYYRIQGPTIIIEYDNTQNNGNHIHSVIRDLQHDFGGDELLQHYKNDHSANNN